VCRDTVVRVLVSKLKMVRAARRRWPLFASYEEDIALRSEKWKTKYDGKRVIMWDDTNVNAPSPQDAETNRHWYSHYYGGCVAEGAVFLQLCGWGSTWELWAGSVSDSDYQTLTEVLETQEKFVMEDPVNSDIPFLNFLDKGYRVVLAAWRAGRQLTLQPDFARSDRRFNSQEVLWYATVANDHSGNERQVNVSKRSGLISRGLQHNQCPSTIADAWLAWGFQVNFMYKLVL